MGHVLTSAWLSLMCFWLALAARNCLQRIAIQIVVPRLPLWLTVWIPEAMQRALETLLRLTVTLSHLSIRVGVRVTLRPLTGRLPVVGAVQVRGCPVRWPRRCSVGAGLLNTPSRYSFLRAVLALQVGLIRVPEFEYEPDLGVLATAMVPLVKAWLDGWVQGSFHRSGHAEEWP